MSEHRTGILKRLIVQAHGGVCHYCGGPRREADHIVARASGGADVADNLIASCRRCNGTKSAKPLPPAFLATALVRLRRAGT
jgi:5-methylcytosine-specific restriction endonuclease McrA